VFFSQVVTGVVFPFSSGSGKTHTFFGPDGLLLHGSALLMKDSSVASANSKA